MKNEILRLEDISKHFYGVKVLDHVRLNLYEGELLGITGLNGCGKTVLTNAISGLCKVDQGTIHINNVKEKVTVKNASRKFGIYYIGQESSLISDMSIIDNVIILGEREKSSFLVNRKYAYIKTKELLSQLNLELDPGQLVGDLSLFQKFLVHMLIALSLKSQIIILDGITNRFESNSLIKIISIIYTLKERGISVVYSSNRLDRIFEIADRIYLLKEGQNLRTIYKDEFSKEKIINLLSDHGYNEHIRRTEFIKQEEILEVKGLTRKGIFRDLDFTLKRGEILGFAINEETVRYDIGETLFGLQHKINGEVLMKGEKINIKNPRSAIKNGIVLIQEQAYLNGLFNNLNLSENVTFLLPQKIKKRIGMIKTGMIDYVARISLERINLAGRQNEDISHLSNLERMNLIIQKWLVIKPKVIILINPTSGMDMIVKESFYKIINDLANEGMAIILITFNLRELIRLSDRIILLKDGSVMSEVSIDESQQIDMVREKIINLFVSKNNL